MPSQSKELSHPNASGIPNEKHVGYFLICKISHWTKWIPVFSPSSKNLLFYHCLHANLESSQRCLPLPLIMPAISPCHFHLDNPMEPVTEINLNEHKFVSCPLAYNLPILVRIQRALSVNLMYLSL